MPDRVTDFFDPEAFGDLSDRDVVTSSSFDASESARTDDLRMEECDLQNEPGADPIGPRAMPPRGRARRRHALSALGAGLAVVGALVVHSFTRTPVVPGPRRPLVVRGREPAATVQPPSRPHSGFATRGGRDRGARPRPRAARAVVGQSRPAALAPPRAGDTSIARGRVAGGDEFSFER